MKSTLGQETEPAANAQEIVIESVTVSRRQRDAQEIVERDFECGSFLFV